MADRLEDQAVAVRVGLSARSGLVLPVLRTGNGTEACGDCLVLGPETPEGAVLRYPAALPAAQQGLALAAALHALRPLRPWPQAPCTLRTPDGPRQAWRCRGRILVEFPAPLLRELTPTEVLAVGLDAAPPASAPWRITLDRAMLAARCPDLETLSAWRMPEGLAAGLRDQGLAGLVLCVLGPHGPLVRSWLDTGQELPSPLAAGAAVSLWWRNSGRETRVQVRWPASGEALEVRLRIGPSGIERLHLPLRVRTA